MMNVNRSVFSVMAAGVIGIGALSMAPHTATAGEPAKQKEAEKAGKSDKAKVGEAAPTFTLTDLNGKSHSLSDFRGKVVLLEWFNPECPAVVLHHKTNKTFKELNTQYASKGVVMLAINSGAPGKQGHGKDLNAKYAKEYGIEYPILLDESGTVGKAYGAKTTPHIFIIDTQGKLVYAGAIDNGGMRSAGDTNHAKNALDEVLAGKPVSKSSTEPYGCSVKYSK